MWPWGGYLRFPDCKCCSSNMFQLVLPCLAPPQWLQRWFFAPAMVGALGWCSWGAMMVAKSPNRPVPCRDPFLTFNSKLLLESLDSFWHPLNIGNPLFQSTKSWVNWIAPLKNKKNRSVDGARSKGGSALDLHKGLMTLSCFFSSHNDSQHISCHSYRAGVDPMTPIYYLKIKKKKTTKDVDFWDSLGIQSPSENGNET